MNSIRPRLRARHFAIVVLCAALGALAACASSSSEPVATPSRPSTLVSGPASATPTAAPSPTAAVFRVRIHDQQVTPRPSTHRVDRAERVRLVVTADRVDEVHVHGYDETARLRPGRAATLTFVADRPGRFEVETHESGLRLLVLEVR